MGKKQAPKTLMSVRLTGEGRRQLSELAQKLGVTQTAVIELVLREKAKREGVG